MKNVAIVVHSCDAYSGLLKGFFYFFEKYVKLPNQYKIYLLVENFDFNHPGVNLIKTGKGQWGHRLKKGLDEVEEDLICYFQEDFWVKTPVDIHLLSKIISLIDFNQYPLLKLHRCLDYRVKKKFTQVDGLVVSLLDKQHSNYLMSHQVSIWNKSFLKGEVKSKESPWQNEKYSTKRMRKMSEVDILQCDFFENNGHMPHNQNEIKSFGQYDTISDRGLFNQYIPHFIEKLAKDSEMRSYKDFLSHHYSNALSHKVNQDPLTLFSWAKRLFKS